MTTTRKSCLVTGCSSGGVGAALAEAFAKKGYHVFATARSPSKVPQFLHDASNATVIALDVASSESIAAVAEAVKSQTGGTLDVLINNAGLGLDMPALDIPISLARKTFDVNYFGVLEMIQMFGPMLVKAQGCIVNNASIGGYMSVPFMTIYQATKAALIQSSEGWRLELAPLGVRVLCLVTGGVDTNFLQNLPSVELPETSFYIGIKDQIAKQEDSVPFGMSPEAYSQDVIRQVERGTTGKYWIGGASTISRVSLWLLPQWVLDKVYVWQKPFLKEFAAQQQKSRKNA
ncbi:hypothetical protein N7478_008942 [Penicillium angulare]|uniref:uncharacterized protein n=1 Tax=Penicillium angulare TaxID=116970 RepID=UPI0025420297|nr:uncharacterized protein N7478_008942 [Penicillium angulare]KAJ5273817.1 hypothetical protein N7478_008942 [Penicillium angulare]